MAPTDPPTPPAVDPRVTALARETERTGRRVGALEALVRTLADQVTALATAGPTPSPDRPGGPVDGDDPTGHVRSWLLTDDEHLAVTDLTDLTEWLSAVYLHYAGAALPSCWAWHPAVVEELRWLREAHRTAYDPETGSWRDVGDWHDRQRPGVVKRVTAAVGACELALHAPGGEQARPPAAAPLVHAAPQLAQHWATSHTSPEPTPDQLTAATQHDRDQHTRNHQ